jgi:hypothetical protein
MEPVMSTMNPTPVTGSSPAEESTANQDLPVLPLWRQRGQQQYFVVVVLLLALPAAYFPQLQLLWRAPTPVVSGNLYITDLDFWQQTERAAKVISQARFDLAYDLNDVPLTVGDWQGKSVPETNQEVMILLEPEQYVQRLYQRTTGEYIWLSMIGGRSSQPFHAPDICYDADNWQYSLGSYPIELDNGGKLYGLWLDATKDDPETNQRLEHVVFYFYLFPDEARQLNDGIVLFKLTSGYHGTLQETLSLHADFIRQLFAGVPAPERPL